MQNSYARSKGLYKNLRDKVEIVLVREEETRDNDGLLYIELLRSFYGVSPEAPISEVVKDKRLPLMTSVSRARRLLQNKKPSLRGQKRVNGHTANMEAEHKAFMPTL